MKRPRSQGEVLEERSSSHRWAPHSRSDGDRKGNGSSSYDRCLDRDREQQQKPWNSSRKRAAEYDVEGFSRRRGGYDRFLESSCGSYGSGDRLQWSHSFSGSSFRREYPKGFRSERDRSRRDETSDGGGVRSSSSRRSSSLKEPEVEQGVTRGDNHVISEENRICKWKDSVSGDHSRSDVGSLKAEDDNSSEMEEGELEPDPEPEKVSEPSCSLNQSIRMDLDDCQDKEANFNSVYEAELKENGPLSSKKTPKFDEEMMVNEETRIDQAPASSDRSTASTLQSYSGGNNTVNCQLTAEEDGHFGLQKQETECMNEKTSEEGRENHAITIFSPCRGENVEKTKHATGTLFELEKETSKESGIDLEAEPNEGNDIDLEMDREPEIIESLSISSEGSGEIKAVEVTLELLTENKKEEAHKDKGKGLAVCESSEENYAVTEGPDDISFEMVLRMGSNMLCKANNDNSASGKNKNDIVKMEALDLSLGLTNALLGTACVQSLPRFPSFRKTNLSISSSSCYPSDSFATSSAFSGLQTTIHNPSCSLDLNLMDTNENSVCSHPKFLVTHHPNVNRVGMNGVKDGNLDYVVGSVDKLDSNGLLWKSIISGQSSPSNNHISYNSKSAPGMNKRLTTREKCSKSVFKTENVDRGQFVFEGLGFVEQMLEKITTEPVQLSGRMLGELSDLLKIYLKEAVCEMIIDSEKHGRLQAFQEALQERPDLTMEALTTCDKMLLEILVSLKNSLPDYIQKGNRIPAHDLAQIFLNTKCRNLLCRSILPVDDCDCKVCRQKNGFCSSCMCLICFKFDLATNTCGWVGCDVCLHWCHTDCALQGSHIRNERSFSSSQGMARMQFYCVACGHPSEMFGFVKEVFRTCAKNWKSEILAKELQYVKRIFSAANDGRGKQLCAFADKILEKLESKANTSEFISCIMAFFDENDPNNLNNYTSITPAMKPRKVVGSNNAPSSSHEALLVKSISSEKAAYLENKATCSNMDCDYLLPQIGSAKLRDIDKMPVADELDRIVKLKQEEARLYQEHADDARRVAEGLLRIVVAKNMKLEEDYAARVTKIGITDAEEERKQKFEQLQALERSHRAFFNMKMRIETDIHNLLLRMQAVRSNFSTKSKDDASGNS